MLYAGAIIIFIILFFTIKTAKEIREIRRDE